MADGVSSLLLRDGRQVRIRRFADQHAPLLEDFFEALSEETLRQRFHSAGLRLKAPALVDGPGTRAYVALEGGRIVGVASYAALNDPRAAEMAVAVADDVRGRGVGTRLFEEISAEARAEGVEHFLALVLPDNREMLGMLAGLGFRQRRRLEDGELEVRVDLEPDAEYQAAADQRQHEAAAASLRPVFRPRGVAVIGAGRRPGSIGHELFRNLLAGGFPGPVYPVNPRATSVAGVHAYPTLADVPGPVDVAVVCVPATDVLQSAREAAAAGVKGLVVISAGFAEVSEAGRGAQDELLAICREAGMRLVGPNCMGILTNAPGFVMNATFAPALPPPGNVAFSSQSGALGVAMLEQARSLGIGVSSFASIGNKADVSSNDLIEHWEDDGQTDVIALYLESFGNPRRFSRIARRVAAHQAIVAVKGGRGNAGRRAASSHTAALAASDVVVDALFRQAGVIRTDTLQELFDAVRLLATQPLPEGRRVAVVTNAGGLGILCVDACEAAGLELPALADETQERLRAILPAEASVGNPVDMLAAGGPASYAETLRIVHDDPHVDAVIVLFVPPLVTRADEVGAALRAVCQEPQIRKPVLTGFVSAQGEPPTLNPPGVTRVVPSYRFPEGAARALGHAADLAAFRRRPAGGVPTFPDIDRAAARALCEQALGDADEAWLSAPDATRLCGLYGLRAPQGRFAASEEEAGEAADAIGGPVVVKLASRTLVHKTDVGGVRLGVRGRDEARRAWREIAGAVRERGLEEQMDGVLVQELVPPGVECLVGVTTDRVFGPLVGFGLGGTAAELMRDVAFRMTPLTDRDVEEMIASVRAGRLLAGYRGSEPADVPAVADTLLRVGRLADDLPLVAELDLNPVVALPPGQGAVTLDARVRVARG